MLSTLDVDGAYFPVDRAGDGSFKDIMLTDVQRGLDQRALFDAVLYLRRGEMLSERNKRSGTGQVESNVSYFFVNDFVLVCCTVLGSHYDIQ